MEDGTGGAGQVPVISAQKARNLILCFLAFLYFLDPINFVDSLAILINLFSFSTL